MKFYVLAVLPLIVTACFGPLNPSDWPPDYTEESDTTSADEHDITADKLIAYWSCDDAEGTVLHDSINGMNATISGAVFDNGVIGGGLRFNGKDNFAVVNTDDPSTSAFGTGDFTISLWVKPQFYQRIEDTSRFDIISKGRIREAGYTVAIAEKSFTVYIGKSKNNLKDRTFDATEEKWYHLVVVRTSDKVEMYVNAVQIFDYTNNEDVSVSGSKLMFGNNASTESNNGFSGVIDEIRFYVRALDKTTIKQIYTSQKPDE